jgi:hypothetical protein
MSKGRRGVVADLTAEPDLASAMPERSADGKTR